MRTDILERKEEILQWIQEEQPKSYIAKQLQCKQETLNRYLTQMGINYIGQQNKKGQYKGAANNYIKAEEYLGTNKQIKSSELKYKLIKDGIKEYKCENCGITKWLDEEVPLELHHIDGNHYNNNLENLLIVCPNCHAYFEKRKTQKDFFPVKTQLIKNRKKNYCIDCGKEINLESTRCVDCYHKSTRGIKTEVPISREELKTLIRSIPFETIGKTFNITGNGIRKWCEKLNLPKTKTEINKYTDEEWEKI